LIKLVLIVVLTFVFVCSPVLAETNFDFESSKYLYSTCEDIPPKGANPYNVIFCRAFIEGTLNALMHFTNLHQIPKQYCLPLGVKEIQIAEVFVNYINENPLELKKAAIINLHQALNNAFPCPETGFSK